MENERLATVEAQLRFHTQELHEIKTDVKSLLAFKWKLIGVWGLIVLVIEIARAKGL